MDKVTNDLIPPRAMPSMDIVRTEIEQGIPVKMPNPIAMNEKHGQNKKQPAPAKQFIESGTEEKGGSSLDDLLKDVNQAVKNPDQDTPKSHWRPKLALKLKSKKSKNDNKVAAQHISKAPVLAMVTAFVVGVALIGAAVYAFKSPQASPSSAKSTPSRVGTSALATDAIQAAGGTVVKPGDLTDLSSDLQAKPATLNDNEDFNQTPLSDKTLGL